MKNRYAIITDDLGIEPNAILDEKTRTLYEQCNFDMDKLCDILNNQAEKIRSLEEQLKNSIKPKFKIGEYLYSVRLFCGQILCAEGYVTSITQLSDKTIHYHLETKSNEQGYKNQFGVEETNCCRTMEECHERTSKLLAELKGERK